MVARLERRASDWMVMPLLRYADFAGRSQRAEFLGFFVLTRDRDPVGARGFPDRLSGHR